MVKAGKPAAGAVAATSADTVKAALLQDIQTLLLAALAKASFTCSNACPVATESCIIKFEPDPATLLVPSTGYQFDPATKQYNPINICALPAAPAGKKTTVTAKCYCTPLI
jgi:hypothetical protein